MIKKIVCCLAGLLAINAGASATDYFDPSAYLPGVTDVEKQKAMFDDPRPYLDRFGPKHVLPADLYKQLVYNMDDMKKQWSDLVGFIAPDMVGNVAPEIKPGRYSHGDLAKYPGLKKLMYDQLAKRIKPGGPPFAGSIPEFEIIPTRQYYWALPVSEMTRRNMHRTTLDENGFLVPGTWQGGYPFPRPEGKFKAQQVIYNFMKRYVGWGNNSYLAGRVTSYNRSLRIDFRARYGLRQLALAGRCIMEPHGFFDNPAQQRAEEKIYAIFWTEPRDFAGGVVTSLTYLDSEKPDTVTIYLPTMRKPRKAAPRDTQDDTSCGQGRIPDDVEGFWQKLSPNRYPYRYEILEEREYLVPAPTLDGSEYITSEGAEFRNVRLERRPLYVIRLTQLDKSYVYGSRILYIDRETFLLYHIENYDQKGRLYRSWDIQYSFFPEMGAFAWSGMLLVKDHINVRSTVDRQYALPAQWKRTDLEVDGFLRAK